jgi:hypothetical protein
MVDGKLLSCQTIFSIFRAVQAGKQDRRSLVSDLLGARGNLGGVTPVFRAASKASKASKGSKGFAPSIKGKSFYAFACVAGRIERLRATNERTSRQLCRISGALPTWGMEY